MRVSSVSANKFSASGILEHMTGSKNDVSTVEPALNTFTSSLKTNEEKTVTDSILEWKIFCEEQIMSNNIDYLA